MDRAIPSEVPSVWVAGIAERIASFVPFNEVACSLRLLNKFSSIQFSSPFQTTVRLSQPCPHHAFAWRWGSNGIRLLNLVERQQLVCFAASSGDLKNLKFALGVTQLSSKQIVQVAEAAAARGHAAVLQWLVYQYGLKDIRLSAEYAAARNGHRAICSWLRDDKSRDAGACRNALQGGHVDLAAWLMLLWHAEWHGDSFRTDSLFVTQLFRAAASSCTLAGMQRFMLAWANGSMESDYNLILPEQQDQAEEQLQREELERLRQRNLIRRFAGGSLSPHQRASLVVAAAFSRTADWREKSEWLVDMGFLAGPEMAEPEAIGKAVMWEFTGPLRNGSSGIRVVGNKVLRDHQPSADVNAGEAEVIRRLQWLQQNGSPPTIAAAVSIAESGHVHAMLYLLQQMGLESVDWQLHLHEWEAGMILDRFAGAGRADVLQQLLACGFPMDLNWVMRRAALGGQLDLLLRAPTLLRLPVEAAAPAPGQVLEGEPGGAAPADSSAGEGALQPPGAGPQGPPWMEVGVWEDAVEGGSLQILDWLAEQAGEGLRSWLVPGLYAAAARGGCWVALEWLAAAGCPMADDGVAYLEAASNKDLLTLRCLRRLGYPWGPGGTTLACCVQSPHNKSPYCDCPLEILRWLLEEGCPLDWELLREALEWRCRSREEEDVTYDEGLELVRWLLREHEEGRV